MAPIDSLRQVEADIRASIERSLDALRVELAERLRTSSDEALGLLRPTALSLPDSFLPPDALAVFAADAAATRRATLADLLAATARIDAARSQADVLRALLAATRGHCGRAALLLAERHGARRWSAQGFDGQVGEPAASAIPWSTTPRWALLAEGKGIVTLAAGDCAPLAEAIGATLPADGVLIPLVLRDRLAAVLYADRARDEPEIGLEALQVLVHVAALAIETLPFRDRRATPTLATGSGDGPGLAIWDGRESTAPGTAPPAAASAPPRDEVAEPPARGAPTPPPPPPPRPRAEEVEDLLFGEAPAPAQAAKAPVGPPASSPWAPVAPPPPPPSAPAPPDLDALDGLPELMLEPLPEFDGEEFEPESPAPPPPRAPTGAETVRVPVSPPSPPAGATGASSIDLSEEDTLLLQRSRADARAATPPVLSSATGPVSIPAALPPPPPAAPSFQGDETFPGMSRSVAPPPPPVVSSPPPAASARSTAEVSAPADVRGPGRAFATRPQNLSSLGEASHEEARRLAKLLVSEIKLYNEDQIEAGRRSADIYSRLKEDIERSRQMYEERIDPRVRAQNDYFQQELVRILAGGDARALGA